MPASITMTDRQHVGAGVSILDQDGQPFDTIPGGTTLAFVSSDPNVADFTIGADGLNGEVTSGKVGSAIITATFSQPGQADQSDTLAVAIINSAAGSLNFTVGTPVEE